jgi:hypothetical protein
VLAAVVAVLAVLGAFLGYRLAGSTPTSRFAGNDLVPISFDYPAGWHQTGDSTNAIFAPHAAEMSALFASRGDAQSWARVGRLLRDDAGSTIGLYTFFVSTQYASSPSNVQQGILQPFLPQSLNFTDAQSQVKLGAFDASMLRGTLSDPANPGTKLQFECYITQIDPASPRTVNVIFFAPADSFDANRGTFDKVRGSMNKRD